MKKADYTVARHTFRLQMEADSPLWQCLNNYDPFKEENPEGTSPVFTLTVAEDEDKTNLSLLTPQVDLDSDGACMELFITADGGRMFRIYLHDEAATRGSHLYISPGYHEATLYFCADATKGNRLFGITNALMLLYAFTTATLDTLLVHASVIANGGKAYLFLGRSGTGKSTHSRLWLQHIPGSTLLNDDNPVIRIAADGIPILYGSPWSGKTPCFRNECAPAGAMVRLSQAPQNRIARLKGIAAYAALAPSLSGMRWETKMADGIHATLSQLVEKVPIFHLQCLPDEPAARLCAQTTKPKNTEPGRKDKPCNE
ncbi:MAG: hypothetical protein RR331_06680 [Bacteroides sp.]